jgi:hypothetical protein
MKVLLSSTLALVLIACGGGTQAPPKSAESKTQANDTSAEEGEVLEEIDRYLEEEGEGSKPSSEAEPAEEAEGTTKTPTDRKEELRNLVKAKRESVSNCYKMAKKKNPNLGTRIAVSFVLKPDGSFKSAPAIAEERTDIADTEVRRCVIDVIESITFPAHPKGMETTFTYPFGF